MSYFGAEAEELLKGDPSPVARVVKSVLPELDQLMTSYAYFNIAFAVAAVVESVVFLVFFSFLANSSLLAFALSAIFLTCFGYFIFRVYYKTMKPEKMIEIKNYFVNSCKTLANYQEGIVEHHMSVANACCRLSESLAGKESAYFSPPAWLNSMAAQLEIMSCWWHWQDIYHMRKLLLTSAIEEHIKLVHCEPTSLEIHAALANAYVLLSALHAEQIKRMENKAKGWFNKDEYAQHLAKQFRSNAQKAIEELKIISDYAPHDPWVHLQLAYSYHDLNMPLEEINQYEIILNINPDDKETKFKLGALYFKQGMNGKGLRVYEELKTCYYKKADALIKLYGQ